MMHKKLLITISIFALLGCSKEEYKLIKTFTTDYGQAYIETTTWGDPTLLLYFKFDNGIGKSVLSTTKRIKASSLTFERSKLKGFYYLVLQDEKILTIVNMESKNFVPTSDAIQLGLLSKEPNLIDLNYAFEDWMYSKE